MPTPRGWLVAALGLGLIVVGRAFGGGIVEQAGFGVVVLVAGAVAVVRLRGDELKIERELTPERAAAGQPVTVSLRMTNEGRGATPLVLLQDRIPRELASPARFALPGLEPGGERVTTFTVTPPRRGRYEMGPVEATFVDPFGLARVRTETAGTASFLAYPKIERLGMPRELGQQRSLALSSIKQPAGGRGDDFYTLREWAQGDDLRKIHWPSTAKREKLMIRQEEISWQTRASILLDDRRASHDGLGPSSSFERAVEGAASLLSLYNRSGYSYRLLQSSTSSCASGRGGAHLDRCLGLLATAGPQPPVAGRPDPLLVRAAELEAAGATEGVLVVVAGTLAPDVAAAVSRCRRVFRQVIVISFPAHRFGQAPTRKRWEGEKKTFEVLRLLARSGVRALVLGPGEPLAPAWSSLSDARAKGGEPWDPKPELV